MKVSENTRILVGLGNPGPVYRLNRHNVGFMVLDELASRLDLRFASPHNGWAEARGDDLVLIKPLWYMNRSGEALKAWSAAAGIPLSGESSPVGAAESEEGVPDTAESGVASAADHMRPLVVCDDLALPLGAVRLRARGSSGGQNGLGDIIEQLSGPEVPRLRLGIAPQAAPVPTAEWPDYVLADFAENEREARDEMVAHAVAALEYYLQADLAATISRFNRRSAPEPGQG